MSTVVLSTQHKPVDWDVLQAGVQTHIIDPIIPQSMCTADFKVLINPGGTFVLGGPAADCGLTGRKIIVDNYGGSCPMVEGRSPERTQRR